jgi:hypothetical protein
MAVLLSGLACGFASFGGVRAESYVSSPSVPQFSIKYVDRSYDIPPTYGTDQYTGKTIITHEGEHVDNRTLEFTIKNQPFTPYTDSSGNYTTLYYNFRFKGPYGTDWSNYPDTAHSYGYYTGMFPDTSASKSDYTTIVINVAALTNYPAGTPGIPSGANVQFEVQAIMGHISIESTGLMAGDFYSFTGERSDWSNTQTITMADGSTSNSKSLFI